MDNKALSFNEALEVAKENIVKNIPYFVIDIVNNMIVKKLQKMIINNDDMTAEIMIQIGQDDVVDKIIEYMNALSPKKENDKCLPFKRSDIFDKRWLDFEALYRIAGWNVEFIKTSCLGERNKHYWLFVI